MCHRGSAVTSKWWGIFGAELKLHELLSRFLSLGLRVSLGWSQINMDRLFKLI
jgi:hypothetical protein